MIHSYLSATSGSTFVARCAGTRQARTATAKSSNATLIKVKGSTALTPYNSFVSNCADAVQLLQCLLTAGLWEGAVRLDAWVDKYFGAIPRPNLTLPRVQTNE